MTKKALIWREDYWRRWRVGATKKVLIWKDCEGGRAGLWACNSERIELSSAYQTRCSPGEQADEQ